MLQDAIDIMDQPVCLILEWQYAFLLGDSILLVHLNLQTSGSQSLWELLGPNLKNMDLCVVRRVVVSRDTDAAECTADWDTSFSYGLFNAISGYGESLLHLAFHIIGNS